jgi:hypothetical protein
MASSKKKTHRNPGTPPSRRRSRAFIPPMGGLGFPVSASLILDVTRIQGVWEEWYRSGVIDRVRSQKAVTRKGWSVKLFLQVETEQHS